MKIAALLLIFLTALTLISTVHAQNSSSADTVTSASLKRRIRVKKVRIDLTTITPTSTAFASPDYTVDNVDVTTNIAKKRKKTKIPIYRTKTVYRIKAKNVLPNGHSYHEEKPEKSGKYHAKSTDKGLLTRKPLLDYEERQPSQQSKYNHLRSGYKDSTAHAQAQPRHTQDYGTKITPASGHSVSIHHPPVNEETRGKGQVVYHKKSKKRLKEKEQEEVSKKFKDDYEKDKPFFPESYYPTSDYFAKEPETIPKESKPKKSENKYGERYPVELTTKSFPSEKKGSYTEKAKYHREPETKSYHGDAPLVPISDHDDASAAPNSYHNDAPPAPNIYHHQSPAVPKTYQYDSAPVPKSYHHKPPPVPKSYHHKPPPVPKSYHNDPPPVSKSYHHDSPPVSKSYHHDSPHYQRDISEDTHDSHEESPKSGYNHDQLPKKLKLKLISEDAKDHDDENGLDLSVADVPPVPKIKKGGRGPRYLPDDYGIPPPPQSRPIYRVQRPPQAHYTPPEPHYYSAPRPRPPYAHGPPTPHSEPYSNEPHPLKDSPHTYDYLTRPPHDEPDHFEPHPRTKSYLPPSPLSQPPLKHYYHNVPKPQPALVHIHKPYMRNPNPYLESSEEEPGSPDMPKHLHKLPTLHERNRHRKYPERHNHRPKTSVKPYYHGADGPIYKAPGYSKENGENNSGSKSKEEDDEKRLELDEPEDEFEKDFERVRFKGDNSIKDGERELRVYGPVEAPKKTPEEHQRVHGPVLLRPQYRVPVYYSRPRLMVKPKQHHHHNHNAYHRPALRPPSGGHKFVVKEFEPPSSQEMDPGALGFSTAFVDFISKLKHFERLYV